VELRGVFKKIENRPMKKGRLLELVQKLGKWERWHFSQFLDSPYFNKRKDVIRLWQFLQQALKSKAVEFNQEKAFQQVYPQEVFEESKYYLVTSYLFKLLEEFLAIQHVRQQPADMLGYQLKAYQEKKLDAHFQRCFRQLESRQNKQLRRDSTYFWDRFSLESEYYRYLGSRTRSGKNNLDQLSEAFDIYFIAEKLKQYCLQKAHQTVAKKEYSLGLQQEMMDFLAQHEALLDYPAIAIYYHCYQAISTGEEYFFKRLLQLIEQYALHFSPSEIRSIYLLAINYGIRQLNTGDPSYNRSMFELYRNGVESDYLLENGELSSYTFNNTALLGIKLKEFTYVESFIKKYHVLLPKSLQQTICNYTLATLRYEQKAYPEAMQLLATFDSNDHLMNLNAKLTLLKIYYEIEEFDALESLLESTRVYLNRKEELGYHKPRYKTIISVAFKLLAIHPHDQKAKATLKKQVQTIEVINMRNWFLQQLEQF
ncbi:MAG: hypothetical protein AAF985_25805, partial [Bacteroidota bacterium]